MSCSIIVDWKTIGAAGLAAIGIIFALKMDSAAAQEAFCKMANACKECVGAIAAPAKL